MAGRRPVRKQWREKPTALESGGRASESRPQVEENLQPRKLRALETIRCSGRVRGAAHARHHEKRPIDLIAEVDADGTYRCRITKAEAYGMRKTIQLLGPARYPSG